MSSTPTQAQRYYAAVRAQGEADRQFLDMVGHQTNPLTNADLVALVARFPERWGRYAGWIGKLEN